MQLYKPYVWVNPAVDAANQHVVEICFNCGIYRTIDSGITFETTEDNHLIIEFPIVSCDDPQDFITYTTESFSPDDHEKITIKITLSDIVKGICTVKPSDEYFFYE